MNSFNNFIKFFKIQSIFLCALFIAFNIDASEKHIKHIFVHGTHGAMLGTGKISDVWRSKKNLYSTRLMSGQMGLVPYESIEKDICAPYMLDAYKEVLNQINNAGNPEFNDASHDFSLFNWSGKLSDSERKKACQVLHDALKVEVESLKKDNIKSEIWLYAHSWGGAVCAYLSDYDDFKDWNIKLMMLATPIDSRIENSIKLFYEKGGRVTHLYSYNDMVQVSDILSGSEQPTPTRRRVKGKALGENSVNFTQMRINTPGRPMGFWETQKMAIKNITCGGIPFSMFPHDPTHADFWCVYWDKNNLFYSPLPVIVWGPILWSLAEKNNSCHDLDVCINCDKVNALFMMQEHGDEKYKNKKPVLDTYELPLTVVKKAQDALAPAQVQVEPATETETLVAIPLA
ncbi:MAG: hypothetical protein ABH827_01685 [bacterium]